MNTRRAGRTLAEGMQAIAITFAVLIGSTAHTREFVLAKEQAPLTLVTITPSDSDENHGTNTIRVQYDDHDYVLPIPDGMSAQAFADSIRSAMDEAKSVADGMAQYKASGQQVESRSGAMVRAFMPIIRALNPTADKRLDGIKGNESYRAARSILIERAGITPQAFSEAFRKECAALPENDPWYRPIVATGGGRGDTNPVDPSADTTTRVGTVSTGTKAQKDESVGGLFRRTAGVANALTDLDVADLDDIATTADVLLSAVQALNGRINAERVRRQATAAQASAASSSVQATQVDMAKLVALLTPEQLATLTA